jgi:hypothetical protein
MRTRYTGLLAAASQTAEGWSPSQAGAVCLTACVLTVLLSALGAADSPVPTLDAQNIKAHITGATNRGFLMLEGDFSATLDNRTGVEMLVAQDPIFLTSAYRLVAPGRWQLLQTSSYYPTPDTKMEACQTVKPGQEFAFRSVPAMAVLKKSDIKRGERIVLRFHLDAACRHGSEVLFQPLVTAPIEVEVPSW